MSYQVLARKWRPRNFNEMVGQEHVLRALVNALEQQRLHHAYLFTGTRGVGKTTIARIFAKSLNCEKGVTSMPCGECRSCVEVDEGRFVDLIEVDAASRTRVEDTREILDNVQYAPTRGRYKVYLIDEVHMLSTSSFNALLKTLEEPPPHVKFLLATTDPQKLPVTVLSRCLQFNLKNMTPDLVAGHLKHVLGEEQIKFDEAALWSLARAADGSMRDALSLTDQAIAFGEGVLHEDEVRSMLGAVARDRVVGLLEHLNAGDGEALLNAAAELASHAADFSNVLEEMLQLLHRIAVLQAVPVMAKGLMEDEQRIKDLAANMLAEEAQLFYQIALTGRRDLPLNPDPRSGFEMLLLRMLAFRPTDQHVAAMPPAASAPVQPGHPQAAAPMQQNQQPGSQQMAGQAPQQSAPADRRSGAIGSHLAQMKASLQGGNQPQQAQPAPSQPVEQPSGKSPREVANPAQAQPASAPVAQAIPAASPASDFAPQPPVQSASAQTAPAAPAAQQAAAQAPVHAPAQPSMEAAVAMANDPASALLQSPFADPFGDAPAPVAPQPQQETQSVTAASRQRKSPVRQAMQATAQPPAEPQMPAAPQVEPQPPVAPQSVVQPQAVPAQHQPPAQQTPAAPVQPQQPAAPAAPAQPAAEVIQVAADSEWWQILQASGAKGITGTIGGNALVMERNPGHWKLLLEGDCASLLTNQRVQALEQAVSQALGQPTRLELEIANQPLANIGETPLARSVRLKQERQAAAEQSLREDPEVQQLMATFGAFIVPGSVEPIDVQPHSANQVH